MKPRKPLRRGKPLQAHPKPCCGRSICSCGKPPSLAPGKPMERHERVKPINRKRRADRFTEAFESEERVEWMASQFCIVPGCDTGPCQVAHVRSRGAGGSADDTVPMCPAHHREQHDIGIRTFESKYGLSLEALAVFYAREWRKWRDR